MLQKYFLYILPLQGIIFIFAFMKKISSLFIRYVIFFVFVILAFWVVLYFFTDTFKQASISKRGEVADFLLVNQDAHVFMSKDMKGKVCIVNFFFTTCKDLCPKMNGQLYKLYKLFYNNPKVMFVSYTVDPDTDTPKQLKHYADSLHINTNKWVFVTGDKLILYKLARFSYGIDDPKNAVSNIQDDFIHSQFLALVDKEGNVRGTVFDSMKSEDMNELIKDILILTKENTKYIIFNTSSPS